MAAAGTSFARSTPKRSTKLIRKERGCRAPLPLSPSPATSVLKREADLAFGSIGVLLLPRTGTIVNLLDLTAIGVPAGFRKNGLPFGILLIAPAFAERALLDLTARLYT
jgi:Asp-tRNA(Asn)/Glu-tRNA(Gln) amidotransferase A subunit family amidase